MILNYFLSSIRKNLGKTILIVLSVSVYFAFMALAITTSRSLEEIAMLPFKAIGVDAIIQKTGKIPSKMTGAIYPHSNGPIYPEEIGAFKKLDFIEKIDTGLYLWDFDSSYFKDVFGIQPDGVIFSNVLKNGLEEGRYILDRNSVVVTKDFAQKNSLSLNSVIKVEQYAFTIVGIARSNLTGNIIPANIYMDLDTALQIAHQSDEMEQLFHNKDKSFVNVVLLKIKPHWKGDVQKIIKGIDKDYLVFSEKTFSSKVAEQIKLISSFGQIALLILGIFLLAAYSFMLIYSFKTREKEIAILRMIGWKMRDLKRQFLSENIILIILALFLGNIIAYMGIYIVSHQRVSMEIPWEISGKPHFLPQENDINRVVTSNIPINYDWRLFFVCSLIFILVLIAINYLVFRRIKNIKPFQYMK